VSDSTARKAIELGRTLDRKVIKGHEAEIERLTAELAEIQAVVDKLPKTADGAAVAPNVEVWYPSPHDDGVYKIRNVLKRGACYMPKTGGSQVNIQYVDISQCYSTREAADDAYKAAEAAKGKTYWDGVLEAAEAAKGKT